MRFPSSITSPEVGVRNPPMIRSVVVFPQPEGPSSVTNSLSFMSRLMFLSIRSPSNSTTMFRRLIIFSIADLPFVYKVWYTRQITVYNKMPVLSMRFFKFDEFFRDCLIIVPQSRRKNPFYPLDKAEYA